MSHRRAPERVRAACRVAAFAAVWAAALAVVAGPARAASAEALPARIGDTLLAGAPAHEPPIPLALEVVVEGLALPVAALALGDGTPRLLVTLLEGTVVLVDEGEPREVPVLDLRHRVTGLEGEQGLFSAALEPPDAAAGRGRGRVVVAAFTELGTGDLVVAAYPLDDVALLADAARERELVRVPMPDPFHHGGKVAFGPDRMLWVSVGDGERGGAFREPPWPTQALDDLRGSVLRIEPLPQGMAGPAYAVPPDNPLVGLGAGRFGEPVRPEIWAYGFRNPWKLHFGPDGRLYVADVGEDDWEEVNVALPGANHGWPAREGPACLTWPDRPGPVDPECDGDAFVDPVVAYRHLHADPAGGRAVAGGVVVRDPALGPLAGAYVFGDFVSGRIWAYHPADGTDPTSGLGGGRVAALLETGLAITGFAHGPDGEVLVVAVQGTIARLVPVDR